MPALLATPQSFVPSQRAGRNKPGSWEKKALVPAGDADREWNKRRGEGGGFPEDRAPKEDAPPVEPDFGLSGKLAEEANTVRGVALLHAEPPEARRPGLRWRLYTFKNGAPPLSRF
jgi:hypothetical protein